MKVTVTYTGAYEDAPGAVEVVSSPYDASWEQCRVRWLYDASGRFWCLAVEKMIGGDWEPGAKLLKHADRWADEGEYTAWLSVNVDLVEVDGQPFWLNPKFDKAPTGEEPSGADL